ncbi:MAG: hypothetical protein ACJ8FY_23495 [Gemmataceae bacterium]
MVQPEEILQRLRKLPFEPFRVILTNGKYYDILNHENNIVYTWCFDIGIPLAGMEDPLADHLETVMLEEIDHLEAVESTIQPAS